MRARFDYLTWDPDKGRLSFRVEEDGRSLWYTTDVAEGVMTGRYALWMACLTPRSVGRNASGSPSARIAT